MILENQVGWPYHSFDCVLYFNMIIKFKFQYCLARPFNLIVSPNFATWIEIYLCLGLIISICWLLLSDEISQLDSMMMILYFSITDITPTPNIHDQKYWEPSHTEEIQIYQRWINFIYLIICLSGHPKTIYQGSSCFGYEMQNIPCIWWYIMETQSNMHTQSI